MQAIAEAALALVFELQTDPRGQGAGAAPQFAPDPVHVTLQAVTPRRSRLRRKSSRLWRLGSIAAGGLASPYRSAGVRLGGGGAIRHQLSMAVAIIERRAE